MIKFFQNYFRKKNINSIKVIGIGYSGEINAFEINKIAKKQSVNLDYLGLDLASTSITRAKKINKLYICNNKNFLSL